MKRAVFLILVGLCSISALANGGGGNGSISPRSSQSKGGGIGLVQGNSTKGHELRLLPGGAIGTRFLAGHELCSQLGGAIG